MTGDTLLTWVALAAAVVALLTYGYVIVRRFRLIRLLTGLGLFLTGLALFQAPTILALTQGDVRVRLAIAALIAAVAAQVASSLRTRPEWTGHERRSDAG